MWIELAEKFNIPIRCMHFTAPVKLCEHNDTVRALAGADFNPEKRGILPHSAFAGFRSRFKAPKVGEGFQDIVTIEFEVRLPFSLIYRSGTNLHNSFKAMKNNSVPGASIGYDRAQNIRLACPLILALHIQ